MPKKIRRRISHKEEKGFVIKFLVAAGIAAVLFFAVFAFIFNIGPFGIPCANTITCAKDLTSRVEPGAKGIFMGREVSAPSFIAAIPESSNVLGENTGEKHIYVDLTKQRLYAFAGDQLVYNFPVSTGKWHHTPTGDFKIWIKLLSTRMSGGSGADYYNLPNVPYTMFFANAQVPRGDGYSIHGAYWHNNFGYPMSHGCVNMRPEDAAVMYSWAEPATTGNTTLATDANPGTTVTIYGETPTN